MQSHLSSLVCGQQYTPSIFPSYCDTFCLSPSILSSKKEYVNSPFDIWLWFVIIITKYPISLNILIAGIENG
ncbi:hypothetical protein ES708_31396 [subsurface metagenome]